MAPWTGRVRSLDEAVDLASAMRALPSSFQDSATSMTVGEGSNQVRLAPMAMGGHVKRVWARPVIHEEAS